MIVDIEPDTEFAKGVAAGIAFHEWLTILVHLKSGDLHHSQSRLQAGQAFNYRVTDDAGLTCHGTRGFHTERSQLFRGDFKQCTAHSVVSRLFDGVVHDGIASVSELIFQDGVSSGTCLEGYVGHVGLGVVEILPDDQRIVFSQ